MDPIVSTAGTALVSAMEEHLAAALPPDGQHGIRSIVMKAGAQVHPRAYPAGHDRRLTDA
ncbi:hypothetical protein GCM10023220_36400 [Streptomyces ziwulingensis]|uniref:Uncharacterized protein n=1 Tax=Streptomyces ziwulingensis TaxID=1045501 RepID=A0ABP9C6L6_9ACTN